MLLAAVVAPRAWGSFARICGVRYCTEACCVTASWASPRRRIASERKCKAKTETAWSGLSELCCSRVGSQLSHDNPHDNPQHRASGRQDGTAGWAGKCPGSDASIRNGTRLHQLAHDTRHVQSPGPKGSRDLFTLDLLKLCLPFRPVKIPRRCTRLI